jgi:hypothetical protein
MDLLVWNHADLEDVSEHEIVIHCTGYDIGNLGGAELDEGVVF